MIYVRNKAEAMEALAAVLALEERHQQIVQITVRLATCLDHEARMFLADCQAGLIEGGLDQMRQKRREMLEAVQADENEPIVIVDPSEDQLLEEVGAALDALRLAGIARQIFANVQDRLPAWRVARAILAEEAEVRSILVEAAKSRGMAEITQRHLEDLLRRMEAARPSWADTAPSIEAACQEAAASGGPAPGNDPGLLFSVVATADHRAANLLEFLAGNRADAMEYLGEIRKRIQLLLELEERESK